MTQVDIAICTFQRPHVAATLQSLAALELPTGVTIRAIVADNDHEPSAQALVAKTAAELNLPLLYVHAPAQNISIARNACLAAATGEYLAFVDDDQRVSATWLKTLLNVARNSGAEAVLSNVTAIYPADAPRWLTVGRFHDSKPHYTRGKITAGYTGGVLLARSAAAFQHLRFDEAYGVTGGEDTDFFTRAVQAGAYMEYAAEAVIYEMVPRHRQTLRWLIRRRIREGATHAAMLRPARHSFRHALLAALKAGYSLALMPLFFLNAVEWRFWLLRGVFHASVAHALLSNA